jgi:putative (di)nucleoside polyphosphate hydrolase
MGRYRPNVAVFVLNRHGHILTCQRSDFTESWQVPQGGVEPGEKVEDTLRRELLEEIGTNRGEIIDKLRRKIRYDWPRELWRDGFCGQEQTFFLFRISPHAKIDLARYKRKHPDSEQEFINYLFLPRERFIKQVTGFRKVAYLKAIEQFSRRAPGIIR